MKFSYKKVKKKIDFPHQRIFQFPMWAAMETEILGDKDSLTLENENSCMNKNSAEPCCAQTYPGWERETTKRFST